MDLLGHRLEHDANIRVSEQGVPSAGEGGDGRNGYRLSLRRRMDPFVEAFSVRE